MANKYTRRGSSSLSIRGTQIKATRSYHLTSIRTATIKNSVNKRQRGCGKTGTLVSCCWARKMVQPLWKPAWRFLRKVKTASPSDPAIPLPSTYPKEVRRGPQRAHCYSQHSQQRSAQQPRGGATQVSTDRGVGKQCGIHAR